MIGCLSESPGLIFYWSQARCNRQLHSLVFGVCLYIFQGWFWCKVCLFFPFQCNFCFLGIFYHWAVDGEVCGVWAFSYDLRPMLNRLEFHTFKIAMVDYNTPLINHIQPFLPLMSHLQIFEDIPLTPVFILFRHRRFRVQISNIYGVNLSGSVPSIWFFMSRGHVEIFVLLVARALPPTTKYIFETKLNTLMKFFMGELYVDCIPEM